mmetsp:Transcript_12413/g.19102  ORF Transcript_12413/g.19102 Transcript_12413/m.19102 type:complete len:160 (+) Transcript_12413:124-603(+)
MISRAFFRLLPFLCLLVASAKQNDTPSRSRRLASPRRLKVKGMNNINNEDNASPSIVEDGWNDRATMGNRHELRFLKKESDSDSTSTKTKTKTKTDEDKESTDGKKGKTKKSDTSSTELVSPTPPSVTTVTPVPAPDEPEIAQLVAAVTEDNTDDDLLS